MASPSDSPIRRFFSRMSGARAEGAAAAEADKPAPLGRELPEAIRALLARPLSWFEEQAAAQPRRGDVPLTHVAFVLDESGSMQPFKGATIEGYNTQVNVVREGARQAGRTLFTQVHFSSTVTIRHVAGSLDSLQPLTDESYQPDGMTALFDALGDTIEALLHSEAIDAPSTATLVTLFTDGEENHSRRYGAQALSQVIRRLEATGRWTFALVGPAGQVTGLAELLSISRGNSAGYDPSSLSDRQRAMDLMSLSSASYMRLRSTGHRSSRDLYEQAEKKAPPKTP